MKMCYMCLSKLKVDDLCFICTAFMNLQSVFSRKDKQQNVTALVMQVTGRSHDKDIRNSVALETSKGAEAPLRNITKKVSYFISS